MAKPWRVPPKCEVICLVHLNGVSKAHAKPTAMCVSPNPGVVVLSCSAIGSFRMPFVGSPPVVCADQRDNA